MIFLKSWSLFLNFHFRIYSWLWCQLDPTPEKLNVQANEGEISDILEIEQRTNKNQEITDLVLRWQQQCFSLTMYTSYLVKMQLESRLSGAEILHLLQMML